VAEVRHAFSKCGGNLGTDGSVAYLFTKRGQILIDNADEDVVMEAALDAGAEDVIGQDDGSIDVATTQNDVVDVKDALLASGIEIVSAEVALVPSTTAELDEESAPKVMKLIDMLEDLDDVQNVYTNANFTDELLELLG
jgi:transcriptional/translational regulatory protein YebC/TACO1